MVVLVFGECRKFVVYTKVNRNENLEMPYNIAVIGCGKLGSRHLQALSQIGLEEVRLIAVDPNNEALQIAKQRIEEMPENGNISAVDYYQSFSKLRGTRLDFCVVATTSVSRKMILQDLVSLCDIDNILLEKFLFQDKEAYSEVSSLFRDKKINAWVNCPRRCWSIYQELAAKLQEYDMTSFNVSGSNWSIATSAIHFIDLVCFLANSERPVITHLDIKKIVPAYSVVTGGRENHYVEFYGSIAGTVDGVTNFHFDCREKEMPFLIQIITDRGVLELFEEFGTGFELSLNSEKVASIAFECETPYQSQLTNKVAEEILTEGRSVLPSYETSKVFHLALLEKYIEKLSSEKQREKEYCPIT